jgi:hypothetical protein
MDAKERRELKEQIAKGINNGLDNIEIYGALPGLTTPAELIGVIRDLMQDRKDYFENRIGD